MKEKSKINYVLIENFTHKINFDLLRIEMEKWKKAEREEFFNISSSLAGN